MASLCGGIIGLPNVGKSTLFNALTQGKAQVGSFPFSTVSPNVGIASVPDSRLESLTKLINPEVTKAAVVEFVDVAGLVRGAHQGEGLGNEFLSRIREVDVLVEVVRCFKEEEIAHLEGDIEPIRDIQIIELELLLSDLEIIERRLTKLNKLVKSEITADKEKLDFLEKVKVNLEKGHSLRKVLRQEEKDELSKEGLLSLKPLLYVANVDEDDLTSPSPLLRRLRRHASEEGIDSIDICAQLEAELKELSSEEKIEFLKELKIEEGIDRLIKEVYRKLNLITFFTITGGKEVRAWPVKRGISISRAAGKVHSDMEKGFIRGEVIVVSDLLKIGSIKRAKEEGRVRTEGKDYLVRDGDVIHFRFSS